MGEGRSLEKLLESYQNDTKTAPSRRLRTLKDWSRIHNWQQRLADIAEAERQAIVARGIAERQNRIDALADRHRRMQRVIESRAQEHADIPGGDTGLLVRQVKVVKVHGEFETDEKGRSRFVPTGEAIEVEEYAVDTALLKEMREHEKQAAIELGQWSEKRDHELGDSFLQALREFGRGSGS